MDIYYLRIWGEAKRFIEVSSSNSTSRSIGPGTFQNHNVLLKGVHNEL
jgi:hypothetical protein